MVKKAKSNNEVVLIISDLQIPYHHPDVFKFLRYLKEKHKPDVVYNIGDLVDAHTLSFHEHDVDLKGTKEEIQATKQSIKKLAEIFPVMKIVEGNHDVRLYRMAKKAGIPRECVRSIHQVYGCPDTWEFHETIKHKLIDGNQVLLIHNCGHSDAAKGVMKYGASIIQGHHHTEAVVKYVSTCDKLMFGMTVGCGIDKNSPAFEYNKFDIKRPILSMGVIDNGIPTIVPMKLNKQGKWKGN